jgi:membrane fusion protein (multidrug efflux system)
MSETDTQNGAVQKNEKRRNTILTVLSFVFLIAGGLWILSLFFDFSSYETTNNAQVEAYINNVVARATGHIKEIRFEANQKVQKGDTMVVLDDSEYIIKVKQAEADLEREKAEAASIMSDMVRKSKYCWCTF